MDLCLHFQIKQENWVFRAGILVLFSKKNSSVLHEKLIRISVLLCLTLLVKDGKTEM